MKKITLFSIFVISLCSIARAQIAADTSDGLTKQISLAKKNILFGLHSRNPGVIESVMILTARIAMRKPAADISAIRMAIEKISDGDRSHTMRFKAYLTLNICADPEWFALDNSLATLEPDRFFISAARRLQQKMLSTEPS